MKSLGIRTRITLMCAALVTAVALLALAAHLLAQQALLRRYFRNTLSSALTLAEDDVHYENGRLDIDRHLDNLASVRISVYDAEGALLYGRVLLDADFQDGAFRLVQGRDGAQWYLCDRRLTPDAGGALWLRACASVSAATGLWNGELWLLAALLPPLALLAALCGWWIARRVLSPVSSMTAIAATIADGSDLKKRIPLSGPHDELYHMALVYNGMLGRLEQSFERERRLSADASHELRTPVAAILNQSEFALSDGATDVDRRSALAAIRDRAAAMGALIGALMLLARMEAGQHPVARECVELDTLCNLAAESLATDAAERNIAIRVRAVPVCTRGDQLLLTRAVLNLLDNAVKFSSDGGDVSLTLDAEGDTARICVEDRGCGMTEEQLERAFERFYRARNARSRPGAGLGLSLADRIARLHGGSLSATSAPGKGSRFTLTLPVAREEENL